MKIKNDGEYKHMNETFNKCLMSSCPLMYLEGMFKDLKEYNPNFENAQYQEMIENQPVTKWMIELDKVWNLDFIDDYIFEVMIDRGLFYHSKGGMSTYGERVISAKHKLFLNSYEEAKNFIMYPTVYTSWFQEIFELDKKVLQKQYERLSLITQRDSIFKQQTKEETVNELNWVVLVDRISLLNFKTDLGIGTCIFEIDVCNEFYSYKNSEELSKTCLHYIGNTLNRKHFKTYKEARDFICNYYVEQNQKEIDKIYKQKELWEKKITEWIKQRSYTPIFQHVVD